MPLLVDSLIVIGLATVSLGNIQEADGPRAHTFVVRNEGRQAVSLLQGYTSCGCTTIHFPKDKVMQPHDTAHVLLRFNPRGKGGEFHEVGTLTYAPTTSSESSFSKSSASKPTSSSAGQAARRKRLQLTLTGTCTTSEETLLRQFPVRISESLRLSADRFDLGRLRIGESRERTVVVLHRDEQDRRERVVVRFTADAKLGRGLHHIKHPIRVTSGGRTLTLHVTLDVLIQ